MEQLILHLFGDYVLQSDWMAQQKTSSSIPALTHATVYSLPFLLLRPSATAFAVILITHFLIDRFRLAKYVVWAKNFLAPKLWYMQPYHLLNNGDKVLLEQTYPTYYVGFEGLRPHYRWENCKATGYTSETPIWMATWLLIIADNAMHLAINYLSLKYL